MKKTKKYQRFVSLLLTLVMVLTVIPFGVAAADAAVPEEGAASIKWEAEDATHLPGDGAKSPNLKITNGSTYSGGKFVENFYDVGGVGCGVRFDKENQRVAAAGKYNVTVYYNKGVSFDGGELTLYKNEEAVGNFVFPYDEGMKGWTKIFPSNTLENVELTPEDILTIKRDADDKEPLLRMDYVLLEKVEEAAPPAEPQTLELEDGERLGSDGKPTDTMKVLEHASFSGGKFVDKLSDCGVGASIRVTPQLEQATEYEVSLQYARSKYVADDGRVGLYRNDELVGEFTLVGIDGGARIPQVSKDAYTLTLKPGDTLSVAVLEPKAGGDASKESMAAMDCLFLKAPGTVEPKPELPALGARWEAENGFLVNPNGVLAHPFIEEKEDASNGKVVSGFAEHGEEVWTGAGVIFQGDIPADGEYDLVIGYWRDGYYEYNVKPSLYVNDSFVQVIDLGATKPNDYFTTDPLQLSLKAGDKIAIKVDDKSTMDADVSLDYIIVTEAVEKAPNPMTEPGFEHEVIWVNSSVPNMTIPTMNVPEGVTLTYSSSNEAVATVNAATGEIDVLANGSATITAKTADDRVNFTAVVHVSDEARTEESIELEVESCIDNNTFTKGADAPDKPGVPGKKTRGGHTVLDGMLDCGHGAKAEMETGITADNEGRYLVSLYYDRGSMYETGLIELWLNDAKVGNFKTEKLNNLGKPSELSETTFLVQLKEGDKLSLRTPTDPAFDLNQCIGGFDKLVLTRDSFAPATEIKLTDMNVAVSEMQAVEVTTVPEGVTDTYSWSTSDPRVAKVDGGMVTAVAEGEATITATSRYFKNIKGTGKVTVGENENLERITSGDLTVTLDTRFPRVVRYDLKDKGSMDGNFQPLTSLLVNKKSYTPEVTFTKKSEDKALYELKVEALNATIEMEATVKDNIFSLEVVNVVEDGTDANRVFTIEIPNLNVVSVLNTESQAEFAGANIVVKVTQNGDTILDLTKVRTADSKAQAYAYAFLTNGQLSAGVSSNAVKLSSSNRTHLTKRTVAEGGNFRTGISSEMWTYRRDDFTKTFQDIPNRYPEEHYDDGKGHTNMVKHTYKSEPESQKPIVSVVITAECNNDGKLNWQDGAVAYRAIANVIKDEEYFKDLVVQRLSTQQSGSGSYPFSAVLDETKRLSLNTDNMGQLLLNKYHNEGFWGDFTHYDDQLGGWREFNKLVDETTNKYNGYVGVHSNFHEYFAKVEQFSPELTIMQSDGFTPKDNGYKAYGAFLQQAYTVDKQADSLSGDRLRRMKIFKEDVPSLGFIYSDVWYEDGLEGRRVGEDYVNADLGYLVEWPYVDFEQSPWSHWAVEKGYGGKDNKGIQSDIMRFIWNHTRDRWDNNAFPNEPGRIANSRNLLIGADTNAYEGWDNGGKTNKYDTAINSIYTNNLPTKLMQHSPILSMEKDAKGYAKRIVFENGMEVYYEGNDPFNRVIKINGQVAYTTDSYLLPWDDGTLGDTNDPTKNPTKFYHWNNKGGDSTWTLPVDWTGTLYLYELTDTGKRNETPVTVVNGQVTLTDIKAKTPYGLYQAKQTMGCDEVDFGTEYINDPGFSKGDLSEWTVTKGNPEVKRNYTEGDNPSYVTSEQRGYELIMEGAEESEVSQPITNLKSGETYTVSVYVEVEQDHQRLATLSVDCGGRTYSNYTKQSIVAQRYRSDAKENTFMLRMQVQFTVPAGVTTATVRLNAAADNSDDPAVVRFDNVRVFDSTIKESASYVQKHADGSDITGKVVLYQDFELTKRTNPQNERDTQKTEFEVNYPLQLGPGSSSGVWAYTPRSQICYKHEPYTQNGLAGSQWNTESYDADDVLAGERTLRAYAVTQGIAFQSVPQMLRFEEGHKYKISFLYQYPAERDGDFEFVVGDGQIPRNSTAYHDPNVANIKEHVALKGTAPAQTEEDRIVEFVYEFTAYSDETWIGLNRKVYVAPTEHPTPMAIDNLLVEDLSVDPDAPVEITGITIKTEPTKKTYTVGEELDVTGGVIEVSYSDGVKTEITMTADMVSGFDSSEAVEKQTLTVTYEGKTATYDVTIKAVEAPVNKDALKAAIDKANGLDEKDYTDNSWLALENALKEAEKVFADGNATQEQVNDAEEALLNAMKNLEKKPSDPGWVPSRPSTPEKPSASEKPESTGQSFRDVAKSDWYYEAVEYVCSNNLMQGVSGGEFAPEMNITRGMIVTILYRLEGEPANGYAGLFADTENNKWYTDAVEWAAKNDIVNGYTTGGFGPNDPVTREQMAAILYRYAAYRGYDVDASTGLESFNDEETISSYAVDTMKWAVANNLLNGSHNNLAPKDKATRAQAAAILMRFCEEVAK